MWSIMNTRLLRRLVAASLCALAVTVTSAPRVVADGVETYPSRIDPACRRGSAQHYDECGSQMVLFKAAQEAARASGKTLIVSYGAEWCIWCHVLPAYLEGASGAFHYRIEGEDVVNREFDPDALAEAEALARFASEKMVLVHIENYYSPDGAAVLRVTGADQHFGNWIPFVFSVSGDGSYAAALDWDRPGLEVRSDRLFTWLRGFDRVILQDELQRMIAAAR